MRPKARWRREQRSHAWLALMHTESGRLMERNLLRVHLRAHKAHPTAHCTRALVYRLFELLDGQGHGSLTYGELQVRAACESKLATMHHPPTHCRKLHIGHAPSVQLQAVRGWPGPTGLKLLARALRNVGAHLAPANVRSDAYFNTLEMAFLVVRVQEYGPRSACPKLVLSEITTQ